jgi:hypothetical protein
MQPLVAAIVTLGGDSARPALAKFFARYHADSSLAADPSALLTAARALWSSGDASFAAVVQYALHDPASSSDLVAGLTSLVEPTSAPVVAAVAAESVVSGPAEPVAATLSDAAIARTLAEHADDLRSCVLAELARNPALRSVRLAFVVRGDGTLAGLQVLPDHDALLQCLRPKLTRARFPRSERAGRLASYTIAVHPEANALAQLQPLAADEQTFWRAAALRAAALPRVTDRPPWWQNQNPLFLSIEAGTAAPVASVPAGPPTKPARDGMPDAAAAVAPPPAVATPTAATASEPKHEPAAETPADAWWLPATAH